MVSLKLHLGTLDAGTKVRWVHTISSGIRSKVLQTNSYRLSTKKQRAKVKKELDLVSN